MSSPNDKLDIEESPESSKLGIKPLTVSIAPGDNSFLLAIRSSSTDLPLEFGTNPSIFDSSRQQGPIGDQLAQLTPGDKPGHPTDPADRSKLPPDRNLVVNFAESQADNHRWDSDRARGIYKCNDFLDACLRAGNVSVPWDAKHPPTVQELVKDPPKDWHKLGSSEEIKPGDVALWNRGAYHHCAILDGKGNAIYAGSAVEPGWAKSELRFMNASPMGKPTVILRPPYKDR